jgi:signal transduction histidine kinase
MGGPDVIHEVKNHLGIILGFVELLLADADLDDHRRADLEEIQKAAQRVVALVPALALDAPRNV